MHLKLCTVLVLLCIVAPASARSRRRRRPHRARAPQAGCDFEYVRSGDWCYYFSGARNRVSFNTAVDICRAQGGDLVSIHSEQENRFLVHRAPDSLIGLRFNATNTSSSCNGNFTWSDGSCVSFRNYDPNFANYVDYFGYCAKLGNQLWTNAECDSIEWPFICKKRPSPFTNEDCPDPNTLYLDGGNLTSPGYPLQYHGSGRQCLYRLAVTNGQLIEIVFEELGLGFSGRGNHRVSDIIDVYEGMNFENRLGRLNSSSPANTTFTTTVLNRMLVTFTARSRHVGRWRATWGAVQKPEPVTVATVAAVEEAELAVKSALGPNVEAEIAAEIPEAKIATGEQQQQVENKAVEQAGSQAPEEKENHVPGENENEVTGQKENQIIEQKEDKLSEEDDNEVPEQKESQAPEHDDEEQPIEQTRVKTNLGKHIEQAAQSSN